MKVTDKAMRPASSDRKCFYCREEIGSDHKVDCVLIKKKVRIRMTVEYEISVPNDWDKDQIEFQRNEGSWCSDNSIDELEKIAEDEGCLCGLTEYEYLEDTSGKFLKED